MEQILVRVRDQSKMPLLLELLNALSFVDSVETTSQMEHDEMPTDDFFALAGLWQDHEIDGDLLRQQAWQRS